MQSRRSLPTGFTRGRWGCQTSITFRPIKLLNYRDRDDELELVVSHNQFGRGRLYLVHLIKRGDDVYVAMAGTRRSRFERLKEQFKTALDSFQVK